MECNNLFKHLSNAVFYCYCTCHYATFNKMQQDELSNIYYMPSYEAAVHP